MTMTIIILMIMMTMIIILKDVAEVRSDRVVADHKIHVQDVELRGVRLDQEETVVLQTEEVHLHKAEEVVLQAGEVAVLLQEVEEAVQAEVVQVVVQVPLIEDLHPFQKQNALV